MPLLKTYPEDPINHPYLSINIINPDTGKSFMYFGLVDTGADDCLIPADFAPALGHDYDKGAIRHGMSAGGPTIDRFHKTIIEILDHSGKLLYTIKETQIGFSDTLKGVVLLGVMGFLENFKLNIDYPNQVFSITSK